MNRLFQLKEEQGDNLDTTFTSPYPKEYPRRYYSIRNRFDGKPFEKHNRLIQNCSQSDSNYDYNGKTFQETVNYWKSISECGSSRNTSIHSTRSNSISGTNKSFDKRNAKQVDESSLFSEAAGDFDRSNSVSDSGLHQQCVSAPKIEIHKNATAEVYPPKMPKFDISKFCQSSRYLSDNSKVSHKDRRLEQEVGKKNKANKNKTNLSDETESKCSYGRNPFSDREKSKKDEARTEIRKKESEGEGHELSPILSDEHEQFRSKLWSFRTDSEIFSFLGKMDSPTRKNKRETSPEFFTSTPVRQHSSVPPNTAVKNSCLIKNAERSIERAKRAIGKRGVDRSSMELARVYNSTTTCLPFEEKRLQNLVQHIRMMNEQIRETKRKIRRYEWAKNDYLLDQQETIDSRTAELKAREHDVLDLKEELEAATSMCEILDNEIHQEEIMALPIASDIFFSSK